MLLINNYDIFLNANKRAHINKLPYTGAVTPLEAFTLLNNDLNIKLVDVRTTAEKDWVGQVHIPIEQKIDVQWILYPKKILNPHFLKQITSIVIDVKTILLFLCRSGKRSHDAAKFVKENGYMQCFNILEGFEGNQNIQGQRKTVNGWCKAGLPWKNN